MQREPLPEGSVILMSNGAKYTIKRCIGRGGFSLVYSAETDGVSSSPAIKEFFPAEGAFRDNGEVRPLHGSEERFNDHLKQFQNEQVISGKLAETSSQIISAVASNERYVAMFAHSRDMHSLGGLVEAWGQGLVLGEENVDPVFPDLIRLWCALHIIESTLIALKAVHNKGYLHLDITDTNVMWAGEEVKNGRACLLDFGCAAKMNEDKVYTSEQYLSYSPGFAAPEMHNKKGSFTRSTDIYSVGMLLFYLCVGKRALEITRNRECKIEREISRLSIPEKFCEKLKEIIVKATDSTPDKRYPDAESMCEAIRALKMKFPNARLTGIIRRVFPCTL